MDESELAQAVRLSFLRISKWSCRFFFVWLSVSRPRHSIAFFHCLMLVHANHLHALVATTYWPG